MGSSGQPEGVTLYDKLTGEAYCAAIAGGEWQKIKGICSPANDQFPISNETPNFNNQSNDQSEEIINTATSTTDVATTTIDSGS